jgi:hypothetical protein
LASKGGGALRTNFSADEPCATVLVWPTVNPRGPLAFAGVLAVGLPLVALLARAQGGETNAEHEVGSASGITSAGSAAPRGAELARASKPHQGASPAPMSQEAEPTDAVRIRVATPDGHGVAGVEVGAMTESTLRTVGRTDASGLLLARGMPTDGSERVCTMSCGGRTASVPVTSQDVVLTTEDALPFTLEIEDAETGVVKESESKWVVTLGTWDARPVTGPEGFVAFDDVSPLLSISEYAQSLRAVYPLRREARVFLTARDEAGALLDSIPTIEVLLGGREVWSLRTEQEGPGAFRLKGVPFFRGAELAVHSASDLEEAQVELRLAEEVEGGRRTGPAVPGGRERLPQTSGEELRLAIVVPSEPTLLPRQFGSVCSCCGPRRRSDKVEALKGSLALHVLRRGGTAAAHAAVRLRETPSGAGGPEAKPQQLQKRLDADGKVTVELDVGAWIVAVLEPGLVPIHAQVLVRAYETKTLSLVEPSGGTILVEVVSETGGPLPYAALQVSQPSGARWADLSDDGVQRVDPFTDFLGRRTLARVEPGAVRVKVTWAGSSAETPVEVGDGGVERIRLVPTAEPR